MKAVFLCLTSVALLCLATADIVSAQRPKPADPTVSTVVGCLVQGSGNPEHAKDFFLRTPAITVPVGTTVVVGGQGRGSATTSAGEPDSTALYRLTGIDTEQLRPHIGHRLEVHARLTGRPEDSTTAKTTVDSTGRPTTRTETKVEIAGVLHVSEFKMVSATCK
jgi:hypothetical protein